MLQNLTWCHFFCRLSNL